MYDDAPPPIDSDGGGTKEAGGGGRLGDTGRWCTRGSGVRVLACVTVGGGLRLMKNSGSARFSIASTECRLNQLVRLGMERVRRGGRVGAVGEVGEVAVVGGWGRKDEKPVTDDVDEGDAGEEVENGDMGDCSECEDDVEIGDERDDGLLRFTDVGRVGECRSDSANIDADEAE